MEISIAELTEIIILGTALLICVNAGSCTYRRKEKSGCARGMGVAEWWDKAQFFFNEMIFFSPLQESWTLRKKTIFDYMKGMQMKCPE